jgi:molybdate transport system ATP-binding protein
MLSVAIRHRLGSFILDAAFDAPGGLTALFGRSGAGKTSLINAIAGLLRPEHGHVAVDGEVLTDSERLVFVPVRRRRIGYVFQEGRLFPHLSVRQNLLYGRWFAPKGGSAGEIDRVIDLLGQPRCRPSAGEFVGWREATRRDRSRPVVATSAVGDGRTLASLDEARKAPAHERLRDASAVSIVYVSHSIAEVTRLATTLVVLSEGRVARSVRGPRKPARSSLTGGPKPARSSRHGSPGSTSTSRSRCCAPMPASCACLGSTYRSGRCCECASEREM